MILSSNRRLKAFTYIEVLLSMLVFFIMIEMTALSYAHTTSRNTQVILREKLFNHALQITQSLVTRDMEKEFGLMFHPENLSPFPFGLEAEFTYPLPCDEFIHAFSIQDSPQIASIKSVVICVKKRMIESEPGLIQYCVYVYQEKGNQIQYGFSSFCQAES